MKTPRTEPPLRTETEPIGFAPTRAQIDAIARLLMPEIKRYFTDARIQREFAEWQKERGAAKG
jgi:hypothetical protein